jgi:apolipoprotein N-acyltransferase
VPPGGSILTGVVSRTIDSKGKLSYYNSLIAIDGRGRVVAGYDKHHLVPYGEYIPFRSILPVRALAGIGVDFSAGPGPETLRVKGLPPFSPFICYEAVFPGEVAPRDDRPGFLLNVTNDGWYGRTAGPYQHFAIARVRAIEEGLPIVRAANTGISGVVDAYGRIQAKLGLAKSGFIDSDLPAPLPPTLFTKMGELLAWFLFGACVMGVLFFRKQN